MERIHVHILDLFSPLIENLTTAGTLTGLDRLVENTEEETEVIHDIIKAQKLIDMGGRNM